MELQSRNMLKLLHPADGVSSLLLYTKQGLCNGAWIVIIVSTIALWILKTNLFFFFSIELHEIFVYDNVHD
jgi:hypothetical protein